MSDGKTEGDQSTTERKESTAKQETAEATVSSIASSIAGMVLERQVRKGRVIEIPSLGITVGKAKPKPANSNGQSKAVGKEEPPKHTGTSS